MSRRLVNVLDHVERFNSDEERAEVLKRLQRLKEIVAATEKRLGLSFAQANPGKVSEETAVAIAKIAYDKGVRDERERCIKIAEDYALKRDVVQETTRYCAGNEIADAIRKGE